MGLHYGFSRDWKENDRDSGRKVNHEGKQRPEAFADKWSFQYSEVYRCKNRNMLIKFNDNMK